MNKSKMRFLICFLLIICLASVQVFAQGKNLKWNLAFLNVKTGKAVPFSAPIQSGTGEQYRLIVQPGAKCFVYIIAEDPEGDVAVLRAGSMANGETWTSESLQITDPKGSDSLFIVASLEEQKVLAQRITALQDNNGASQRRALMTEVFRIRSDTSKFKEAPEKPVLMGGASRGSEDKSEGVEFSGVGTYVKTISIEH